MIPRETIDQVFATLKIEEVVSDYVTLRRRGANLIGLCPFHDEKTGSFTVSPAKGIYKCFGCGKAGNAVNFIMEYEHCSYTEAIKMIAKRYHIEVKEKELTEEEKQLHDERESLFAVNEWARQWFIDQLWNTEEGENIGLSYFRERGLRDDIIRKFQLGYSPNKNALYPAAKQAGYQDTFIEKTGLCGKSERGYYDRFRDRVIFPILSVSGKTVAFAGRLLKQKEHVGKYVNSPDSTIYSKQNELYGLALAKNAIVKENNCYLVEGQMDVISMFQAGVENVVSSGGTSLTHPQIRLIHRFTNNITVIYDGDKAGIKAALRGIDMLLEEGLNVKVVLLPDGEDPDSFARQHNASDFIQYINTNKQDFIHFKTVLLLDETSKDPIKRSEVIKSIVTSISLIPDVITRQVYEQRCSEQLSMPEATLHNEVDRIRKDYIERKRAERERAKQREAAGNETAQQASTQENNTQETPSPATTETTETTETNTNTTQETNVYFTPPSSKLETNIRNLLQVLVRYGEKPMFADDNGNVETVGEYILRELEDNQIEFENPLYAKVISELKIHINDPGFVAEDFFKYHPNNYISALAVELISEKYNLSKIYGKLSVSENVQQEIKIPTDADRLNDLVPQLVYDMQLTLVVEQINHLNSLLQHAQNENNYALAIDIMHQIDPLNETRKVLERLSGNRIVR